MRLRALFIRFLNRHGTSHGSADHGVVAHTDQPHHFYMRRYGRRACKLCIPVHTAHGVCQAIGSRTCRNIVGMERTAGAAAGGNGKIFFPVLVGPFLISSGYQMLKTRRIGRVSGNGNINAFPLHNRHALIDIVCAAERSPSENFRVSVTLSSLVAKLNSVFT